jgi:hypothetical protein
VADCDTPVAAEAAAAQLVQSVNGTKSQLQTATPCSQQSNNPTTDADRARRQRPRRRLSQRHDLEENLSDATLLILPDASHGAQSQHAEVFLANARLFLNG